VDPDAPNVLHAMMKLEEANVRAKTANKVALEEEKENDAAEKAVEELKRKRQCNAFQVERESQLLV
jgi:hypothetical protein